MRKEILLNIEIITLVIDSKNKRIKLNKVIGYLKKVMTTIFFFTVDKNIVKKWIIRYKETGDIMDKEGRGHKKSTSAEEDQLILSLFDRNDKMSLTRLGLWTR